MAFVYDPEQYKTYDAERHLTFLLTNPNKEEEATLSLRHDDGSGVVAVAYPRDPSADLNAKINALRASYGEAWTIAMPRGGDYSIGGIVYSEAELADLLKEAADAYVMKKVSTGEIALCELFIQF